LRVYRSHFQPSEHLDRPYDAIGVNAWGADTDEEAEFVSSSHKLAFSNFITNNRGKTPIPVQNAQEYIAPHALPQVIRMLSRSVYGSQQSLQQQLSQLAEQYNLDEVIVTNMIHNPAKRIESFEITAAALKSI